MIRSVLLSLLLLFPSLISSSDDSLETISVNTGETATLICDLPERYSNRQVDFYGPGGRLLVTKTGEDDRKRYMLAHTYAWTWSLILSDVSDDDIGEYTCRISSETIIKRFNLTVLTPPKIVDITIESNHHAILLENEQVLLKCLARGNPSPTIKWHYSDIKTSVDRNFLSYENKFLIKNFSRTTPSNYQCIADNGIPPRDTRTIHLVPAILPEVTIQSSLTRFSSHILLNCTIVARPLTSAKWKHNRLEIVKNIQRTQLNDYTLQFILLLPIDSPSLFGMYECEGENEFRMAKAFLILDDSILSNLTTRKQSRISASSPSYAQFELLLNCSSWLTYNFQIIFFVQILVVCICDIRVCVFFCL